MPVLVMESLYSQGEDFSVVVLSDLGEPDRLFRVDACAGACRSRAVATTQRL